jgi:hypothetical protein
MSIYKTNEHYVYLYLREEDRTPYYVGKGKGGRYKEKHRVNIPKNEENIIFLAKNLTNDEACKLEKELISFYGRKDLGEGILHNQTDGGDGGDTSKSENYQYWLENIARNKNSDYNKAITQRMKENNPLFDPEIAAKCQTPEARKKRGDSRRGKPMPESAKERLREIAKLESAEKSIRMKNIWNNCDYRKKFSKGAKKAVSDVKNMTEKEFYEWVKNKKLFTKDGKTGNLRPNSRVKLVVEHFDKMEEFYGNFYREKENNKKKSWYYKDCPEKEFLEWIVNQSIYRKDGNKNPRIFSIIRHRGLEDQYYQKKFPPLDGESPSCFQ